MGLRASYFLATDPAGTDAGGIQVPRRFAGRDGTAEGPYPAPTFLTSFTSANLTSGARSAV